MPSGTAIADTIRQPVRFLVSSPYHNPYSKGNIAYADVWKIGHEHYRTDLVRQLERDKASPEEQKARLPNQTFSDRVTLYLGGKEIQILHLGRAHTQGDSILYVPQDRIVYLSEVFSAGQFLFMNDGYGLDWLKTVEAALSLDADIFVPGHGPFPPTPSKAGMSFSVIDRCWWMSVIPSRRRLLAACRRTRPSPPSNGHSMKSCEAMTPKGRTSSGDFIGN